MKVQTQEVVLQPTTSKDAKENKPKVVKWKGEEMIRAHSIRASVKEILQVAEALDVVKVGIVGEPSTGKTTLAGTIAHLCHDLSKVPFAYRQFGKEEFLNMRATLDSLSPTNYILYFHDLSFLTANAKKKDIEIVKQVITEIRHLRQDVKIILIYDYHYTLGLDKYLRQANFRYFTSIGSSEEDNMIKIVGAKYTKRVSEFQKKFVNMTTKKKAKFRLNENKWFFYNYKNPFVVCLFWNNSSLRYIAFPKREWIEPICSTCSQATGELLESEISVDQFKEECTKKFGPGVFEAAVKLELFANGMNVYSRTVVSAQRYLSKALKTKLISLEELAQTYGFTITKTKLRKQLDGVLEKTDSNLVS